MNWNTIGRGSVATLVSAALGFGTISCSRDFTVAYVYATAVQGTTGFVDGYLVDYQSGALTQLANSPIASGGRNPVTLVAAPSGKYIYVLNRDDSNVVQFAVGTDGKLYAENTYNVVGSFPVAAAIDATGSYLYVASTYQPGFTTALPGPGNLTIFPINTADGTLDPTTATTVATGNTPIGVAVSGYPTGSTTHFIYVADRETVVPAGSTTSSAQGFIQTFAQVQGSTTLTRITAGESATQGVSSGVQPSGIAVDPTSRFLYVTDALSNQVGGYLVTTTGLPQAMTNGPFATGQYPSSLTIDPRAKYLYVTNYNAATVTAYSIDQATGNLAGSVGSASVAVKTNPTCVTIEPALGIYLYTSNNGDQSVSGLQLSPNNGTLTQIQNTPYPASALPSCIVAVANGQHATQVVNNQ